MATAGLVLVATAAVFAAVGVLQSTYPSRLASAVLSWQGAVALTLTFGWGLADLVVFRRLRRPLLTDKAAVKRVVTVHAVGAAVTVLVLGADLGLLVTAGLAIKTAVMIGATFLAVWIGLVIAALIIVGLRRRSRRPAGPRPS